MTTSFAQTTEKEDIQLKEAYDEIKTEMNSGMYELSFNTFKKEYEAGDYDNVDEYAKSFSDNIAINNAGDDKWFYNTGTSLPQKPKYNRYNLLNLVKPGDIIYEENGSDGIFHHIAIVEGIFYDETLGEHYIRLIEAILPGVCRSVLDDERLEYKDSHILRVSTFDSGKTKR